MATFVQNKSRKSMQTGVFQIFLENAYCEEIMNGFKKNLWFERETRKQLYQFEMRDKKKKMTPRVLD